MSVSTGPFTNVPAGFVADATAGPSLAGARDAGQRRAAGRPPTISRELQVRIITANAVGNDEWVGIDDISGRRPAAARRSRALSVTDVSVTEGDTGVVTAHVLVRLTSPAGPGRRDVRRGHGRRLGARRPTPTTSRSRSPRQTIAEGASEAAVDVSVVGDTFIEPNEAFAVVVGNVVGANVGRRLRSRHDPQRRRAADHDPRHPGRRRHVAAGRRDGVRRAASSPALKSNGFFLQTPDADADTDPQTSEGIVVFTGVDAAAGRRRGRAAAGDRHRHRVRARRRSGAAAADRDRRRLTIVPVADRPARCRRRSRSRRRTSTRRRPIEALEKVEGMRVSFASLTVTAPDAGLPQRGLRPRRRRAASSTPSSPACRGPSASPASRCRIRLPAGAPAVDPALRRQPRAPPRRQRRASPAPRRSTCRRAR